MFAIFDDDILPVKFTNTLWMSTVDTVTVKNDKTLHYCFQAESECNVLTSAVRLRLHTSRAYHKHDDRLEQIAQ